MKSGASTTNFAPAAGGRAAPGIVRPLVLRQIVEIALDECCISACQLTFANQRMSPKLASAAKGSAALQHVIEDRLRRRGNHGQVATDAFGCGYQIVRSETKTPPSPAGLDVLQARGPTLPRLGDELVGTHFAYGCIALESTRTITIDEFVD